MKYIVETKELTKVYGKSVSVKDLDLRMPEGCVYGFLGPNGAGKSTTMKMLLNLIKPTQGEIQIFGEKLTQKNRLDILKNTGSLIESPSYYGHLTGRENLEIVQMLKDADKKEIDEVLDVVRMEKQQHKKADHYSLGMKQRLGIAQALLGKPRLLLLDEPTNGLDPAGIQEIRELICSLPEKFGMTVIISSHLLSEIDQMADYVGILDHGEMIFQDSMQALKRYSDRSICIKTLDDAMAVSFMKNNGMEAEWKQEGIMLSNMQDHEIASLNAFLVQKKIGVVRIEEQHKSLEDIFLSLTGRSMSL